MSYDPLGLFEDSPEQSAPQSQSMWGQAKDLGLGAAHSVATMVGGIPGFVGGAALAAGDVLSGHEKPSVALAGMMGAAEDVNPYSWAQEKLGQKDKLDQLSGNEIVNKYIMSVPGKAIELAGQGYGNIAKAFGLSESKAKEVDSALQIALGVGSLGIGGKGVGKLRGLDAQSFESFKKARETYPEVKPEGPVSPSHNMTNDPLGLFTEPIRQPDTYTPEELQQRNQDSAQGEVRSAVESLQSGRQAETGTKDIFGQQTGLEQPFTMSEGSIGSRDRIPTGEIAQQLDPSFKADPLDSGFNHDQTQFPLDSNIQPDGSKGGSFKGYGGASEQSNMSADLFRPGEDMSARPDGPIPYEKAGLPAPIPEEPIPSEQKPRYLPYTSTRLIGGSSSRGMGFRQRGNITPGVFLEGLKTILGIVPRTLEAAKDHLESRIQSAMDRRDTVMRPLYEKTLEEVKRQIRGPIQGPSNQQGSIDIKQIAEGVSGLGEKKWLRPRTEITDARREEIRLIRDKQNPEVAKAVGGDVKAFTNLWKDSERRLGRFLSRRLGNEADVHDVLQNTAKKAFEVKDQYNGKSAFNSWLHTIADSEAKMYLRAKDSRLPEDMRGQEMVDTQREQVSGDRAPDTPDAILEGKQEQDTMNQAYESLPRDQRTAIQMMLEEIPYKDIAEKMSTSEDNIKQLISRARKGLKEALSGGSVIGSAKGPGKYQRGNVNFGVQDWINKKLDERKSKVGTMGAVKEIAAQFQLEKSRQPLAKFMEGIVPDSIKDISDIGRLFAKGLTDKTISILAEGRTGADRLLKWVIDNEKMIDTERDLNIEASAKGEKFVKGEGVFSRGWEHHLWGDEGATVVYKRLFKKTPNEIVDMNKTWIEAGKRNEEPTFKNNKQAEAYAPIKKQLDQALETVNKTLRSLEMPEIPALKGFFPSLWEGDYRISVNDKNDGHPHYGAYKTIYHAKLAEAKLREEFPDMEVSKIYHVERSKYDLDTTASEQILRAFSSDDPAAKAIQKAYAYLEGKRGFGGKRIIQKEFVGGFKGSEGGTKGAINMEGAIHTYLSKMYTLDANLKKNQIVKQVAEIPLEIRKKIPNTISLVNDWMVQARGGELTNMLKGVDVMAVTLAKGMGLGESSVARGIASTRSIMGAYWLFNPKFIFSQIPQSLNSLAKMVDLYQDGARNPLVATFEGISRTIKPDAGAIDAVNWARRNGRLDSVIVELMGSELGLEKNKVSDLLQAGTGWTLGKVETEVVRTSSFLMFESSLKDGIKDPKQRYETAAELMDHYMVNYRQAAKPMIYNHLGTVVGKSSAALKQFSHNAFGQFFEYLKIAKDEHRTAPLVTYMGTQALIGGLKGTILVAEADAIINLLNEYGEQSGAKNDQIPTVSEWLLTSGASDNAIFGLASVVSGFGIGPGQDMSGSVGAPAAMSLFSMPTVEFDSKVTKEVGLYIIKSMAGVNTSDDAYAALLAISPNAVKASVEKQFTGQGQPVRNPMTHEGNYVRSDWEWFWDQAFGGRSIPESKANALARFAKQDIMYNKSQKDSAISAITDRVTQGKPIDPQLMQKYVQDGGSAAGLTSAIKTEILKRNLTYFERQQMGKASNSKARDMSLIQDKLNVNPGRPKQNDPLGILND